MRITVKRRWQVKGCCGKANLKKKLSLEQGKWFLNARPFPFIRNPSMRDLASSSETLKCATLPLHQKSIFAASSLTSSSSPFVTLAHGCGVTKFLSSPNQIYAMASKNLHRTPPQLWRIILKLQIGFMSWLPESATSTNATSYSSWFFAGARTSNTVQGNLAPDSPQSHANN